jgi:hypothetical protein
MYSDVSPSGEPGKLTSLPERTTANFTITNRRFARQRARRSLDLTRVRIWLVQGHVAVVVAEVYACAQMLDDLVYESDKPEGKRSWYDHAQSVTQEARTANFT